MAIVTENVTLGGKEYVKTYSNANLMIACDGMRYISAYDLPDSVRTYTETDIPADPTDNEVYRLMEIGTEIPTYADLNDYTDVGVYWASGNVVLPTLTNAPFPSDSYMGFNLEVSKTGGTLMQVASAYQGAVKTRYYQHWLATPAWTSWEHSQKNYIESKVATKQDTLTFDSTPTSGSSNPVTSGGVYSALNNKANTTNPTLTWNVGDESTAVALRRAGSSPDYSLSLVTTKNGSNIFNALINADGSRAWATPAEVAAKQNALTWDSVPTDGSSNPVTSDGIYDSLYSAVNGSLTFDSAVTNGSGTIRRCGRLVMINMQWTAPSTVVANQVIATMPAGFRPLFTVNATAVQRWGQACCPVSFNANGNIAHLSNAYTASRQYSCTVTFIRAV